MIDLTRSIRAVRARQGGFSSVVISAAVDYEGNQRSSGIELTITKATYTTMPDDSTLVGSVTVTETLGLSFIFLIIVKGNDTGFGFADPLQIAVYQPNIPDENPLGGTYSLRYSEVMTGYSVEALNGAQVIYEPLPGWPPVPDPYA